MDILLASLNGGLFALRETLVPLLTVPAGLLVFVLFGLAFYGYVADLAGFEGGGRVNSQALNRWDALLGSVLMLFFIGLVLQASSTGRVSEPDAATPRAADVVVGTVTVALIFLVLIGGILAALRLRQISWSITFGLTRVGVFRVIGWGVVLLMLAYPLISMASFLSETLLAASGDNDDSKQDLVNFFMQSKSGPAKWVVAVSAMIVAPIQEEFLFRGYIYAVCRRYGGVLFGLLLNAMLFALIHLHLPSFAPLFVLAVCLTLAYEWTGSIWVPMCMHALFNSVTVITLLSGHEG